MRGARRLRWLLSMLFGCCWLPLAQALDTPPARATARPDQPLQPLSSAEIALTFQTLSAHIAQSPELPRQALLYPLVSLKEPSKALLRARSPERPVPREAEVQLLHWPSNRSWLAIVDLGQKRVTSLRATATGSQPALAGEEYEVAAQLVRAHLPWRQAVQARGVDPVRAHIDVWAPGELPISDVQLAALSHGRATRLARCLTFDGGQPTTPGSSHPYTRPVDGVVVLVDLNARRVVEMSDVAMQQPVINETGNARGPARPLKPLEVREPRGSNIELRGQQVRWQGWQFEVAMQPREGAVFYDVRSEARGALRQVAHRLALSEIYVPYGFADPEWSWRSAFDVGEYNAGALAQELEVNRDVPENARFLPATFASSRGPNPKQPTGARKVRHALALYERDAGVLWTRTDPNSGARETRMARELVVSWLTSIGNYLYGFDWIFKQDGSIEVRVQLTGTTLNRGASAREEPGAPKVASDERGVLVAAPNHQHFFNFRLDLDVDGPDNHVMESQLERLGSASTANGFDKRKHALTREGAHDVDASKSRKWCVMSSSVHNVLGAATAFTLEPGSAITPLSADEFPGLKRAGFARHALWVTRYAEEEWFAAGRYPSQGASSDALPSYVTPAEPLTPERGDDVVLWYTLGMSHVPRLEDYPVMSSESVGFRLVPHGFFDRNPALEVGDQRSSR